MKNDWKAVLAIPCYANRRFGFILHARRVLQSGNSIDSEVFAFVPRDDCQTEEARVNAAKTLPNVTVNSTQEFLLIQQEDYLATTWTPTKCFAPGMIPSSCFVDIYKNQSLASGNLPYKIAPALVLPFRHIISAKWLTVAPSTFGVLTKTDEGNESAANFAVIDVAHQGIHSPLVTFRLEHPYAANLVDFVCGWDYQSEIQGDGTIEGSSLLSYFEEFFALHIVWENGDVYTYSPIILPSRLRLPGWLKGFIDFIKPQLQNLFPAGEHALQESIDPWCKLTDLFRKIPFIDEGPEVNCQLPNTARHKPFFYNVEDAINTHDQEQFGIKPIISTLGITVSSAPPRIKSIVWVAPRCLFILSERELHRDDDESASSLCSLAVLMGMSEKGCLNCFENNGKQRLFVPLKCTLEVPGSPISVRAIDPEGLPSAAIVVTTQTELKVDFPNLDYVFGKEIVADGTCPRLSIRVVKEKENSKKATLHLAAWTSGDKQKESVNSQSNGEDHQLRTDTRSMDIEEQEKREKLQESLKEMCEGELDRVLADISTDRLRNLKTFQDFKDQCDIFRGVVAKFNKMSEILENEQNEAERLIKEARDMADELADQQVGISERQKELLSQAKEVEQRQSVIETRLSEAESLNKESISTQIEAFVRDTLARENLTSKEKVMGAVMPSYIELEAKIATLVAEYMSKTKPFATTLKLQSDNNGTSAAKLEDNLIRMKFRLRDLVKQLERGG